MRSGGVGWNSLWAACFNSNRQWTLIVDDVELLIRAAIDGVGLGFVSDERVEQHLASGVLVRVLEDWFPPFPGFLCYYPSRRQQPVAYPALMESLRLEEWLRLCL